MCGIIVYSNKNIKAPRQELSHRGPDETVRIKTQDENYTFIFHRLAINDMSPNARQPFIANYNKLFVMCNGEIYNHKELEEEFNITTDSGSDCHVILYLYQKIGFKKMVERLDGVFAIALYDQTRATLFMARDPLGVRPLFYNLNYNSFASEAKALPNSVHTKPFPPNHIYNSLFNKFEQYKSPMMFEHNNYSNLLSLKEIQNQVKILFFKAVKKRIENTERPVGLLLSGGFDSSIVCSVAHSLFPTTKFHTFSIGCKDSSDLKYARQMSEYINSQHHEIIYTTQEALHAIPEVVKALETYDITTVRASTPMYLLAKYISTKTDVKVLLSGEGADEFGSYKYFFDAPSTDHASNESRRLFNDIHLFDVLRADRSTASHGLELRVPFLDLDFFDFMHKIPAQFHRPAVINPLTIPFMIEKRNLRDTFTGLLPDEILWRKKDAFSDSVGDSWRQALIDHTDNLFADEDFDILSAKYKPNSNPPPSKEALWYRIIFDTYYNRLALNNTPYYWMPKWSKSSNSTDPSAKVLN